MPESDELSFSFEELRDWEAECRKAAATMEKSGDGPRSRMFYCIAALLNEKTIDMTAEELEDNDPGRLHRC